MEPYQPERRRARRYELGLSVTLDGVPGESTNLSSSGLFVLSKCACEPGQRVAVEVFFPELPGAAKRIQGTGRVIRVDPDSGRAGMGIELEDWGFA